MDENIKASIGNEERIRRPYTLALIQNDRRVLLGLKKRGFGTGFWNGFGGKIESGESIDEAAAREIQEECGLVVKPEDLEKFGVITFEFEGEPVLMEVHLFKTQTFTGEIQETEEMVPKWFPLDSLPHAEMWPDDEIWYPLYLQGQKFTGYFFFKGYTKIISYILRDLNGKILSEKKNSLSGMFNH